MGKKLFGDVQTKKPDSPYIFILIRNAKKYGIDYDLMCRLNYKDLQALIIEFTIKDYEEALRQKRKDQLNKRGIGEVKTISGEEVTKFLGGSRNGRYN